jgi:hypothetical protein
MKGKLTLPTDSASALKKSCSMSMGIALLGDFSLVWFPSCATARAVGGAMLLLMKTQHPDARRAHPIEVPFQGDKICLSSRPIQIG